MRQRLRRLVLLAPIAAALAGRPAQAGVSDDLGAWLDGDAAAVVRIDAAQVEQAVALLRSSGLPGVFETLTMAQAGAGLALGFDPFSPAGWFAAGIDGRAPVMASVAAIDRSAVDRLVTARGATDRPVLWRTRAALRLDDPARATRSLVGITRLAAGGWEVDAGNGKAIARLVGAADADAPRVVADLRAAGVIAAAAVPAAGAVVLVSRHGDVALIDLVQPYAGEPLDWRRDRAALLALLARKPGGPGGRLRRGAGARLTQPGLVAWIDPVRLAGALAAWQREDAVAMVRAGRLRGDLRPAPALCGDIDALAASGPFEDLALSLTIGGGRSRRVVAGAQWTLRGAGKLAGALTVSDDGILDPQELVSSRSAAAAGAVYLRGLAPLRALPRPAMLSGSRRLEAVTQVCGPRATALAWLFGWPQVIGMLADELAAVHPDAARAVAALRNTGFTAKVASADRRRLVGVAEASVDPAAAPLVESWLDLVFGARTRKPAADRRPAHTAWGRGPMRPWSLRAGAVAVFGAGLGERAREWYLSQPRPQRGPRPDLVAEVHGDLRTLWTQAAPSLPPGLDAARALWNRLERFSATMRVGTDQLEVVAEVAIH